MPKLRSFKPSSKAERKFVRQERRLQSRKQTCFQAPNDSGGYCITRDLELNATDIGHPLNYGKSPDQYFEDAISSISTDCPISTFNPALIGCETYGAYSFQYSQLQQSGSWNHPETVKHNFDLTINKQICFDTNGTLPQNPELDKCMDKFLGQANAQAIDSFKVMPPWEQALLAAGIIILGVVLGGSCYGFLTRPPGSGNCKKKSQQISSPDLTARLLIGPSEDRAPASAIAHSTVSSSVQLG